MTFSNDSDYYRAASAPKTIWMIAEAEHVGGFDAGPREYERRALLRPRAARGVIRRRFGMSRGTTAAPPGGQVPVSAQGRPSQGGALAISGLRVFHIGPAMTEAVFGDRPRADGREDPDSNP